MVAVFIQFIYKWFTVDHFYFISINKCPTSANTLLYISKFNLKKKYFTLLLVFLRWRLEGDFIQNSLCSREHSIKGSAGSLLSKLLGGAAGSVALKFTELFQGKGEEAREAPREVLGLTTREGFLEWFLDGFPEGLGDRDLL